MMPLPCSQASKGCSPHIEWNKNKNSSWWSDKKILLWWPLLLPIPLPDTLCNAYLHCFSHRGFLKCHEHSHSASIQSIYPQWNFTGIIVILDICIILRMRPSLNALSKVRSSSIYLLQQLYFSPNYSSLPHSIYVFTCQFPFPGERRDYHFYSPLLSEARTACDIYLEALNKCGEWMNEWMGMEIYQMDQLNDMQT